MTSAANKILQDALGLSDDERVAVAEMLFSSVAPDAQMDDELRELLKQRIAEIRDGRAELQTWEQVREAGRAALRAR